MSFNKPPPQKTSNKWPNDAPVHRDPIYIDIQINKSGFSTQYHIPWHTQVTISFPPQHKTMHHSSPPQGCRKLGTQRPISHPLVPASHSPLDTSVTHKPRRPPLSIGPEPDTQASARATHPENNRVNNPPYTSVQTNWLTSASINSAQIQALKNQG